MSSPPNPTIPLIAGPYRPPRRRYPAASTVEDLMRGDVVYVGVSDAPIPWPLGRSWPRAKPSPIVMGDLERAIRTEAVEAIAHHWGVSRWTVRRWRVALGVGRMDAEGTRQLWIERAGKLHTPAARARQKAAMKAVGRRRRAGSPGRNLAT